MLLLYDRKRNRRANNRPQLIIYCRVSCHANVMHVEEEEAEESEIDAHKWKFEYKNITRL